MLTNFHGLTGKCFLFLNENIFEQIVLKGKQRIQKDYLINTFPRFLNLSIFYAVRLDNFDNFVECLSLCSNLKKLVIYIENCSHKNLIKAISSSKDLEMLTIYSKNRAVTENFFHYISSNLPNLTYLNLIMSDVTTDLDFGILCNLSNLETLKIEQLDVTGTGLGKLCNLKELYCNGCKNLGEDNLISLLRSASNLELLEVRRCLKVTNSIINVAIEETKNRKNNLVLRVLVRGTKIQISEIKEKSGFLHLDFS